MKLIKVKDKSSLYEAILETYYSVDNLTMKVKRDVVTIKALTEEGANTKYNILLADCKSKEQVKKEMIKDIENRIDHNEYIINRFKTNIVEGQDSVIKLKKELEKVKCL